MHRKTFGGVHIFRSHPQTVRFFRNAARAHLLREFHVGGYPDSDFANRILQHQFEFFSKNLTALVPKLVTRDALEFVLFQYDQAGKILHAKGIKHPAEAEQWLGIEGNFRRALKYLAEMICLLGESGAPKVTREESFAAMDGGILAERDGGDRYEGTPTIPGVAGFTAALIANLGQAHPDFLQRYDHCRRATFVCCWHKAEQEALQMWLGYCREASAGGSQSIPGGFALQTTERRLQHQFLKFHDLHRTQGEQYFLRDIDYVDHRTHEPPPAFGEEVFLKATWFRDEKELRLGVQRLDCACAGSVAQIQERLTALPRYIRLAVDLNAITETLVINPDASAANRGAITSLIAERYPDLVRRIRTSALEVPPVA